MKAWKKTVSILLALVLTVSMIPLSAISAGAVPDDYIVVVADVPAELPSGTAWYRFIPEESGWYKISASGSYMDFFFDLYDSDGDWMGSNYNNALEAGKTYYCQTEAYYTDDDPCYFLITKMVPATGVVISEGDAGVGYTDTTMRLTPEFVPLNAIPEEYEWTSSDETVAKSTVYNTISCLKAGKTTLTLTTENGLTAEYQLTVKETEALVLDEAKDLTITACGEIAYLTFTPAESGWYHYCADSDNDDSISVSLFDDEMDYIDSDFGGPLSFNWKLEAGKKYYIANRFYDFFSTGVLSVQMTQASAPEAISTEFGDSVTGFVGMKKSAYVSFEPEGCYREDYEWTSTDSDVAEVDDRDGCLHYKKAGEATVTVTSESGLTASCKVTVKDPLAISVGETKEVDNPDGTVGLYFTPSEDGYYRFSVDLEDNVYAKIRIEDCYGSYSSSWTYGQNDVSRKLSAGDPCFLIAEVDTYDAERFSVSLEKLEPATAISITQGDSFTMYEKTGTWFEAELLPKGSAPEDYEWTSSNNDVATVTTYDGYVRAIAPGETVLTVTSENGLTAECTLTVKAIPAIRLNETETVTSVDKNESYFAFTPEEDGWYRYYSDSDEYDTVGNLYDSNMDSIDRNDDYNDRNFEIRAELSAGETYYLSAAAYSGNMVSFPVRIEKLPSAESVSIDLSEDFVGYAGTRKQLDVSFSPEKSAPETYSWKSSDKKVLTVNEDDVAEFKKAGSSTVTLTTKNGLTTSRTIKVIEPTELKLNETKHVRVSEARENAVFRFTAPATGNYEFIYNDRDNNYLNARNADLEGCYSRDSWYDSETELQHRIFYLDKEDTIFLETGSYLGASEYDLKVVNAAAASSFSFQEGDAIKGMAGDWISLTPVFDPPHSICTITSFSSDAPSVAEISEYDNEIRLNSRGVARITAETDNGLQAVCTITVLDAQDMVPLALGKGKQAIATADDPDGFFTFTPDRDGTYLFSTYDNGGVALGARLSDERRSFSETDWGDSDGNVQIKAILKAGKTYIFKTMRDDNNKTTVPYKVKVEKVKGISKVEIISPPDKKEYIRDLLQNEFDPVGLSARLTWDDGTDTVWTCTGSYRDDYINYEYVNYYIDYDGMDDGKVRVSYGNKSDECQLTLTDNPVDRIVVNTAPTREYVLGDLNYCSLDSINNGNVLYYFNPSDLTGLSFTVYFKDGSSKQYTWKDMDGNRRIDGHTLNTTSLDREMQPGETPVTLHYMNKTAQYNVKIKDPGVESLEILKGPDNPEYNSRYFSPDWRGTKFRVHYKNGTVKDVEVDNPRRNAAMYLSVFDADGYQGAILTRQGTQFMLTYLGKACDITGVQAKPGKLIKSVLLNSFNETTGALSVTVTYDDNTTEVINVGSAVSIGKIGPQAYGYYGFTPQGMVTYTVYSTSDEDSNIYIFGKDVKIEGSSEEYLLGDTDGDGIVTIIDATYIQRWLADLDKDETGLIKKCGDVDGDGEVTIVDATYIQRYLAGFKVDYPIEQPIA